MLKNIFVSDESRLRTKAVICLKNDCSRRPDIAKPYCKSMNWKAQEEEMPKKKFVQNYLKQRIIRISQLPFPLLSHSLSKLKSYAYTLLNINYITRDTRKETKRKFKASLTGITFFVNVASSRGGYCGARASFCLRRRRPIYTHFFRPFLRRLAKVGLVNILQEKIQQRMLSRAKQERSRDGKNVNTERAAISGTVRYVEFQNK